MSKLEVCPECGEEPIILRTFEDWARKVGCMDGDWYRHPEHIVPMYACMKDKLFWSPNPPFWKKILLGPYAFPKEFRA